MSLLPLDGEGARRMPVVGVNPEGVSFWPVAHATADHQRHLQSNLLRHTHPYAIRTPTRCASPPLGSGELLIFLIRMVRGCEKGTLLSSGGPVVTVDDLAGRRGAALLLDVRLGSTGWGGASGIVESRRLACGS